MEELNVDTINYIFSPFSANILKFVSPDLKIYKDLIKVEYIS